MKLFNLIGGIILAGSLLTVSADKTIEAGPKGGLLLKTEAPHPEFLVGKDRKITITFYGPDRKQVAPGTQEVTVIAEAKTGKKTIEFEKKEEALVSKTALPEGEPYTVVLQLRPEPGARPKNFRIPLILSECGGCKHPEYVCTCDE